MGTITYSTARNNASLIFRATSGGTVFSANLSSQTNFDYFTDTAQVNDAIYFCCNSSNVAWSNLYLTIGTPMVANCTLVWEYWCSYPDQWRTCHNLTDGSNGLTTAGAVTINFPFQANGMYTTVNGYSKYWIRCRIASLTSISEGGANSTTVVKGSYASVDVNGYTDASPCSWNEVYNWIVANAPEIGAYKWGNAFKFDNCQFAIYSTLRTTKEVIFVGNGCYYQTFNFSYLWSGTKIGTNGWFEPSYFFLSTNGQSNQFNFTANSRVYGGAISTSNFVNFVDGLNCRNGGYVGPSLGEHIGVYYPKSGYFNQGTVDRCILEGGIISSTKPPVYPTNLQISNPKNYIWSIYGNELDASNVTYALPGVSMIFTASQYYPTSSAYNINITNPNPALPLQTGYPKVISRPFGSNSNLLNVFLYDASAGTYTDYTTQSINNTVDDVPVSGDVGDILYMNMGTSLGTSAYQPALTFTITNQSNDYSYVWEYNKSTNGQWEVIPSEAVFDNTNNFTQSGVIYFATGNYFSNVVSVNGITGAWIRCRIVSKGLNTPTLSKIQYRKQLGIWLTSINEKYTVNLTVKDILGTPIQGATVTIKDITGNITTFTTDINGAINSTDFITNITKFDKNESEANYNYSTTTKNPFTIKVKKEGYGTYVETISITSIMDKTVSLEKLPTAIYLINGSTL